FSPFADNGSEQGRLQNRKVVVAISRFAWVPRTSVNSLTVTPAPAAPQSVDSENVRVVTLPGGGIRITTRQD
ncbi:MAG: cell envelope biogenesis protein OmpA, partial [Aeromonas veronii]